METAGGTHFPLASQSGWQATAQEGSFAVSEKGGMVVMGCWFAAKKESVIGSRAQYSGKIHTHRVCFS